MKLININPVLYSIIFLFAILFLLLIPYLLLISLIQLNILNTSANFESYLAMLVILFTITSLFVYRPTGITNRVDKI